MNSQNGKMSLLRCLAKPVLVGVVVGCITCFVILLILAGVATVYSLPHGYVLPLAVAATAGGAFAAGWCSAKIMARNGWLVGLLVSFILFLLTMLAGAGLYHEWQGMYMLIKCVIMLACGMLGGMIAVNTHSSPNHRYR